MPGPATATSRSWSRNCHSTARARSGAASITASRCSPGFVVLADEKVRVRGDGARSLLVCSFSASHYLPLGPVGTLKSFPCAAASATLWWLGTGGGEEGFGLGCSSEGRRGRWRPPHDLRRAITSPPHARLSLPSVAGSRFPLPSPKHLSYVELRSTRGREQK